MGNVKWKKNSSVLEMENQVAMINGETFIKVNKEYFNIIDTIVREELDVSELANYFSDKNDCEKIIEIISCLQSIGVMSGSELIENNFDGDGSYSISLIITNRCNLSCKHCSQAADEMDSVKKELSFDDICRIIDLIVKYDVDKITITGGEPLVRNDFFEIINYLRSKYNGTLILLTNGLLISENNVQEITHLFNYISISIDGIDEELTSIIRGKGVFEKIVDKIKLLHSYNYKNIELSAILPNSVEIEKKFEKLCQELSVKAVQRSLIYSGRAYDNSRIIHYAFENYIKKYGYSSYDDIESLSIGDLELCDACRKILSIDFRGDVFPCNLLQEDTYRIGNILEEPRLLDKYKDTCVSKKIEKIRRMEVEPCKNCEVKNLCWFCLADFEVLKMNKVLFKDYCNKRKKSIYKFYFKE